MNIVISDKSLKLRKLAKGSLFMYNNDLCLKSEYVTDDGYIEAYIVGSGEMFYGGVKNPSEQYNLDIYPVEVEK